MMLNYKDFIELIKEEVYVSQSEIPSGIKEWIKDVSGTNIRDYKVDQSGKKVHIGMPWHQGCMEIYQFFNLVGTDAFPVGNPVTRKGWESDSPQDYIEGQTKEGDVEVPAGKVLVKYCSYPKGVKIYTSVGAELFLADTTKSDDLTEEELIILQTTKELKSFARPKFPAEFYDKLISKGLLAKNRSITNDGRNLISNPDVKAKIKTAVENHNKKHGWGSHLSLNIM